LIQTFFDIIFSRTQLITTLFSPNQPHSSPRSIRGFTLVELLTVTAIISILAVLSVPSLGLLSSRALNSGGNQIADIATMARQNSVAQNCYTAIVIMTQGKGAYSAYCTLAFTLSDSGVGSWQTLTPWRYLPQGIVFSSQNYQPTSPSSFLISSGSTSSSITWPMYPFEGTQIDLTPGKQTSSQGGYQQTMSQIYQPDGTLLSGQSVKLRLIEGTSNNSGTIALTHPNSSGQPASYYDIVFIRDTGQTKIERP